MKFCSVDEPVERMLPNVPSPVVVNVSLPRSIAPKPDVIEPTFRAPTDVSDEVTTEEPSVVASRTFALLIRNTPFVGKLMFPPVKDRPPLNVEVASPTTVRPPNEADEANRLVDEAVVAKDVVDVAFVVVLFRPVKF